MFMAARIRHFILSLPEGRMFSSRDLLEHGSRDTIDQTLHRLVSKGIIVRITRGVYMKETENGWRPSVEEVARFKAKTFSKEIIIELQNDATSGEKETDENSETTFICTGGSSSFLYGKKRIHFKGIRPQRLKLQDIPTINGVSIMLDFSTSGPSNGTVQETVRILPIWTRTESPSKINFLSSRVGLSALLANISSCG